jgi:hypothetical protein
MPVLFKMPGASDTECLGVLTNNLHHSPRAERLAFVAEKA